MFNRNEFNSAIAKKGSNQKEAARVMGMNPSTLNRKMTGFSDFYRREIEAFCDFYEVQPDSIFFAAPSA